MPSWFPQAIAGPDRPFPVRPFHNSSFILHNSPPSPLRFLRFLLFKIPVFSRVPGISWFQILFLISAPQSVNDSQLREDFLHLPFRVFRIFRGLNSPVFFPSSFGPKPTACPAPPSLATSLWLRLRRAVFLAGPPHPCSSVSIRG